MDPAGPTTDKLAPRSPYKRYATFHNAVPGLRLSCWAAQSRVFYPRSMQNRTFSRIFGVLLYCLSVSEGKSEIHQEVEVLLHAYEITDAERSLLNKLPPEVVVLLTQRLNAV